MSALSRGVVRRWSPGILAGAFLFGVAAVTLNACSSAGGPPPQAADAPIRVQTSDLFLTVENKAGMPLTDVDVAIVPAGNPTAFNKYVGRLENGEKRNLSLGDFAGRDGTTFNRRMVRPKSVRVKAKDMVGKAYDVEAPW
jgi:hypothetical protein